MALQGTYTHYTYSNDEVNTVETEVTYPLYLEADHPDYEKRGTTEIITTPGTIETSETYVDAYIVVKCASVQNLAILWDISRVELTYSYLVFPSKESYLNSKGDDNSLMEEFEVMDWDWDINSNPFETVYNNIKSKRGCEALIND